MKYNIGQMTYNQVIEILTWKYEGDYSIYNMDNSEEEIKELLNGTYYSAIDEQNNLFGFYCYGSSAQVPIGWELGAYDASDVLDIGLGMRPDLCGRGLGYEFMQQGMDFAVKQFDIKSLRLTVAAFNKRGIKVYERAGFEKVSSFERVSNNESIIFDVMVKY